MIAIGGAIGTGLFLGAGARLQIAGPALAAVYLFCGLFSFLILRALGELVMYRPTSGSFVSYAARVLWREGLVHRRLDVLPQLGHDRDRRYHGRRALHEVLGDVFGRAAVVVRPRIALGIVGGCNMVAVKWFGEMEFWFSIIKVGALVLFLIIGFGLLVSGHGIGGQTPGMHLIAENGGIFPHGVLPAVIIIQGVVFAYAGIELIGTAAGEAQDPEKVLPRAINSVMWRIALFYVGSVVLLVTLLPWTAYQAGTSPFVTFFGKLGVPGIGTAMNVVVLTAALSSLNSGLYSTGRVLRSLAMGGSAPAYVGRMNAAKVPYGGIVVTLAVYLVGVVLNYFVPSQVFEIVLNVASLGIVSTWGFIVLCQMRLRQAINAGRIAPVSFRMPAAPFTSWLTLAFLLGVLILMAFDYPDGTFTIAAIPIVALVLYIGWRVLKGSDPFSPTIPSYELTRIVENDPKAD